MATKAGPGRADREGISLLEFLQTYPTDKAAERWFAEQRWPSGVCCPQCGSLDVQTGCQHKTMPYRCREKACGRPRFSVKTGTVMECSNLGYQTWLTAMFLVLSNLKGVSSMKLHRDLRVTQKSAWFLAHRLRAALTTSGTLYVGPVEVDETYFGGKRKNMPKHKRAQLTGRGASGKSAVVGAKDRDSKQVTAGAVPDTKADTLRGFATAAAAPGATVYTDDATAYDGLPRQRTSVKHSAGEYVRGQAHINGIESFWSLLKRGYIGIYHKFSPKHLDRYVQEFTGRHNIRDLDTADQLLTVGRSMAGKRLTYRRLIAKNGLPSGARAAA